MKSRSLSLFIFLLVAVFLSVGCDDGGAKSTSLDATSDTAPVDGVTADLIDTNQGDGADTNGLPDAADTQADVQSDIVVGHVSVVGQTIGFTDHQIVEGVEVCVVGNATLPCAITDADGNYTLTGLPANTELALTYTRNGYKPLLVPINTRAAGANDEIELSFALGTDLEFLAMASVAGAQDLDKGMAALGAYADFPFTPFDGIAGAAISITPSQGLGPVYVGTNQLPDPALTETSFFGIATFGDLDAGTYEASVAHAERLCTPNALSWEGSTPDAIAFPVLDGYLTEAAHLCTHTPSWGCVGNVTWPTPTEATVGFMTHTFDLRTSAPVAANITACAKVDSTCASSITFTYTGRSSGLMDFRNALPAGTQGFDGYFDLSAADYFPERVYENPPYAETVGALNSMPMIQSADFASMASLLGVALDPAMGHVMVVGQDCESYAAAGLTFGDIGGLSPVYMRDGTPVPAATATDLSGAALFLNIAPGAVTATQMSGGVTQGSASAEVVAGTLTIIRSAPSN